MARRKDCAIHITSTRGLTPMVHKCGGERSPAIQSSILRLLRFQRMSRLIASGYGKD
jgi:hypothetical protein